MIIKPIMYDIETTPSELSMLSQALSNSLGRKDYTEPYLDKIRMLKAHIDKWLRAED